MNVQIDEKELTVELKVSPGEANPEVDRVVSRAGDSQPRPSDDLPQFSDQFETLQLMSQDGFGCLYRVRNVRMETDFVVRHIPNALLPTEEAKKSFLRFCRRYMTVTHPALPPLYSFQESESGIWFVSDVTNDRSLEQMIDDGDLKSTTTVVSIFEQLVDCTEALHQVGIKLGATHPHSILVNEGPNGYQLRLRDWWGHALLQARRDNLQAETMPYASPEQIDENGKLDLRSDIYSLGALLYEVLSEHTPYSDENLVKLAIKIVNGTPPAVDGAFATSGLSKIAMRCLSRNPEQRYQSLEDVREDLKAAARNKPLPSEDSEKNKPSWQRKNVLTFLVAFCIFFWMFGIAFRADEFSDNIDGQQPAIEAEDLIPVIAAKQADIAKDPNNPDLWLELARAQLDEYKYKDADVSLKRAIALSPSFTEAYAELADMKYLLGEPKEALEYAKRAVELDPINPQFRTSLAVSFWGVGDMDNAISAALEATRLDPNDTNAQYALALMYDEAKKYPEAVAAYKAASALEPMSLRNHTNLSAVYSRMKDHLKAITEATIATEMNATEVDAWDALGHAYLRAGRLSEAETSYRKAVSVDKFAAKAVLGLAETLAKQGKRAEAKALRRELLD